MGLQNMHTDHIVVQRCHHHELVQALLGKLQARYRLKITILMHTIQTLSWNLFITRKIFAEKMCTEQAFKKTRGWFARLLVTFDNACGAEWHDIRFPNTFKMDICHIVWYSTRLQWVLLLSYIIRDSRPTTCQRKRYSTSLPSASTVICTTPTYLEPDIPFLAVQTPTILFLNTWDHCTSICRLIVHNWNFHGLIPYFI